MIPVYSLKFRPVSPWTLPEGVEYQLRSLPWDFQGNRPDLKRSSFRYGEFTTNRPLTPDELARFDAVVVRHI